MSNDRLTREVAGAQRPVAFRLWSLTILLIMGTAWGLSFSLAKIATASGVHPFAVTFWQTLCGGGVLLGLLALSGQGLALHRRAIRLYLCSGLLGAALPGVLFYLAAPHLPAGVLSISVALIPILTFALSALFRLEPASLRRLLGMLLGAGAIATVVLPGGSLPDSTSAAWVLVACAAASCYAAWNLAIAVWRDRSVSPLATTCGMYLSAATMMAAVSWASGTLVPLALPFGAVEWSIVGMGLISAVAYGLFVYLVGLAGAVFASQASYIVTLSGVAWGMAIFGESHPPSFWLALVVMCLGLSLVTPRATPLRRPPSSP
ncbi:hypothetical protein AY600_14195 [Phormidium willei BDU 130791]|nr:hypothetical protein AY600_14195 [Phormidium willei BDU 130791]